MWSLTKRVKSVGEDNKEVLPWQTVYPHDGLAQCLFSVGLAVTEEVIEAFTSKSWFFSIVSSGWTVKYGDGTRLSCLTTLTVRLLSPLLTCLSLHVYSPFCFCPFPPASTLYTILCRSCLLRCPTLCEVAESIIPIVQSGSGFSSVGLELNSCCGGWRR